MRNKRQALMRRFEDAVRAHEMKGSRPPEEWAEIDAELGEVRKLLRDQLKHTLKAPKIEVEEFSVEGDLVPITVDAAAQFLREDSPQKKTLISAYIIVACGDVFEKIGRRYDSYGPRSEDVPMPIRQAILLMLATRWEHKNIGKPVTTPMMVDALLMPYRKLK